jgi:hypothetical protein
MLLVVFLPDLPFLPQGLQDALQITAHVISRCHWIKKANGPDSPATLIHEASLDEYLKLNLMESMNLDFPYLKTHAKLRL